MSPEDALGVVGVLNAGFPREAIEGETLALYLAEVGQLENARAAFFATRLICRHGEHFPKIVEFRQAYHQALDRIRSDTPAIEEGPRDTVLPDSVKEWMAERGIGA